MSAYFHEILRAQHRELKKELKDKGIEMPKRGRKAVDLENIELKRKLLAKPIPKDE